MPTVGTVDLWDRVKGALGVNSTVVRAALDGGTGVRFAVDATAVPAALFGLTTYEDAITPAPRVSRAEAIQCAAVKRSRDVIAGTLGSLPLDYVDSDFRRSRSPLLEQPERDVPRSVTMVQTFEDILFEGRAFWRVVERDWRDYPKRVRRLDPRSVDIRDQEKTYVRRDGSTQGQAWEYVKDTDIIRFWSPNDALLIAAARSIRSCLELDATAGRYANEPMPLGYFSPKEGADPATDEDITDLLDGWNADRRARANGYVPEALDYNVVQFNAEQIQLSAARQHAVIDIARHAGLDPEDLGVSTTSRTYQNGDSRQRALIDNTLSPYMVAVQDRLSMGDVTPGGYRAAFDLNGFLRSNEDQRIETYVKALDAGLYDRELIRQREQLPPISVPAPAAQVMPLRSVPTAREATVAATATGGAQFEDTPLQLGFEVDEPATTFEVNREERTIYGLAVPYGVVARSNGRKFVFSKGSIQLPQQTGRVKLLVSHDRSQAVGKAVELEDTDTGLWARFKVARGPAGDHALSMAEDGVWDGLSIGTTDDAQFEERGGVHHAINVPIWETSLTPHPAFSDARVSAVAAEADTKGTTMPDAGTETAPPTAVTFDQNALAGAIAQAMRDTAGPIPVSVAGGRIESVREELPYRFDGTRGEHDFSSDLFAMGQGDWEAKQRVEQFMGAAFDVDNADAAALNPSPTRPDLYVDQREFRYPLWEAVRSGTLSDNTPFIVPKFNTSSGLVANHTEGVEPTPGAFTATSQTITPQAVSGKVEITREVWDRGGNPQLSGLIWRQMVRAYYEALEAYVVSVLDAASPTGITVTTAGTDKALAKEVALKLAALQFIRGGFRFDTLALQVDLYQALVGAVDDTGRPLFPLLGPANANGSASPLWGSLNVGGLQGIPSWALAATGTVAASSYLFDREAVHGWATSPQRLTFEYRVAYVDVAIWGYKAAAITDLAGVREVIYDPTA